MLKIAFVGCGRISSKHFDALDKLWREIEVQALCDIDIERARGARSTRECCRSAKIYNDIEAMLAAENGLDAAVIALPNGLHAAAGALCAHAGLHVIVEKPLAVRLADGEKLLAACRQNQVQLFLIHQNRFNPPVQQLYCAIGSGYLGRIYSLHANVFWTRPQSYYDSEGSWHGSKELDGGAFYTQASHYVDMVQWLAGGRPDRIWSQLRTMARDIETEDCGMAFMEWGTAGSPQNIIASINMSILTYPRNLEGSVLVLGEKGSVKIGGTAMNKVENWQVAGMDAARLEFGSYDTDSVYGFGHQNLYAAIAARLRGESQDAGTEAALVNGPDILDNLAIIEGIQRSAQGGGRIINL